MILEASQPRHLHHGSSVQQRINQALDLISNDVASLNVNTRSFGAGNVPLYENSSKKHLYKFFYTLFFPCLDPADNASGVGPYLREQLKLFTHIPPD